jgi:REP element-mobilizing transposase RayT
MTAENRKPGKPPRLRRLDQIFARWPIYFITACTWRRRRILATDELHNAFVQFAIEGPKHGAWIGAYVLMPDHFHLFVAVDDERRRLSEWMKSLKNTLSKSLRSKKIPSPHFQKDFFDHLLRSSESYAQKWRYVRDNPVRTGLVERWGDWPFSGEMFSVEFASDD